MSDQEDEPGVDQETCLNALAIAIPICWNHKILYFERVKGLRCTCKRLKELIDGLLTELRVEEAYVPGVGSGRPDFEILLLRPSLLQNIQTLNIALHLDEDTAEKKYVAETRRILNATAHNIRSLSIWRPPTHLSVLMKDLNWPHLQSLILMGSGNIAGIKKELFEMRQLRCLHYNYNNSNKYDRKALLSAPFLYNLTELKLIMHGKGFTPLYMSRLFVRTIKLEKLELVGYLEFDYFGSNNIKLEHLTELVLHGWDGVHFGPLLFHPRPTLQKLTINYGFLTTEQLESFISSATLVLPNLQYLKIDQHEKYDDDYVFDDSLDWNCLGKIDLPNLVELYIECTFKEIVNILQPTANLPKLKNLDIGGWDQTRHPRNYSHYAERMFSSPLLQQLTTLRLRSECFRIESLKILCKYAPEFKDLEHLTVHSRNQEGIRLIADAGKAGGFPKLKHLVLTNMHLFCDYEALITSFTLYDAEMEKLKEIWPNISYRFHGSKNEKYGQPDEFEEVAIELVVDDIENW